MKKISLSLSKKHKTILAIVAILGLAGFGTTQAFEYGAFAKVSATQAAQAVKAAMPNAVITDVDYEYQRFGSFYEVEAIDNHQKIEVLVNADDGTIMTKTQAS